VFRDRATAEQAFDTLRSWGYSDREINVLMSDQTRNSFYPARAQARHEAGTMATEGMGVGGAIGTAVGASLAAILAIGSTLVVPGLGLVVAGPIAAALAGGGAGAVTGGVVGALVGWGITEPNARAYEDALRNGGVVIGVQARDGKDASRVEKVFKDLKAENVYSCSC
jgi:hypothetical protein